MSLRCIFFDHKWDGCICRRCGAKQHVDYTNAHDWAGCCCRKCGQIDKNSDAHDWDGCICRKCGYVGDNHDWDGSICRKCGHIDVNRSIDNNGDAGDNHLLESMYCNHEWEPVAQWSDGSSWVCKKCNEVRYFL